MKINVVASYSSVQKTLEVRPETTLSTLKAIIEIEFHISATAQVLEHNQRIFTEADEESTLISLGIYHESTLTLLPQRLPQHVPDISEPDYNTIAMNLVAQTEQLPSHLSNYIHLKPELADAIKQKDVSLVAKQLKEYRENKLKEVEEQKQKLYKILQNPESVEAQQLVLQQIHQQQIDEAYLHAQEFLPESFGVVPMTYVHLELNGRKITAFIDSGAQSTLMSLRCVEECDLMRFVDKRFKGIAQGVGSSNIIGRIHLTQIKLGTRFFASSIIVLEDQKIDFLFGLDLLRRHQCILDYKENVLRVDNEVIPFLSEFEIKEVILNHPTSTSSGPSISEPVMPTSIDTIHHNGTGQYNEYLNNLLMIGATREEAEKALRETNNNVELAAALILQKKESS